MNNLVEFYFAQLLSYNIKWSYYAIYHKAVGCDLGHIKVWKDYYFIYFLGLITAF